MSLCCEETGQQKLTGLERTFLLGLGIITDDDYHYHYHYHH